MKVVWLNITSTMPTLNKNPYKIHLDISRNMTQKGIGVMGWLTNKLSLWTVNQIIVCEQGE